MVTHAIPHLVQLCFVWMCVGFCGFGTDRCDQLSLYEIHLEGTFHFATLGTVVLLCCHYCFDDSPCVRSGYSFWISNWSSFSHVSVWSKTFLVNIDHTTVQCIATNFCLIFVDCSLFQIYIQTASLGLFIQKLVWRPLHCASIHLIAFHLKIYSLCLRDNVI